MVHGKEFNSPHTIIALDIDRLQCPTPLGTWVVDFGCSLTAKISFHGKVIYQYNEMFQDSDAFILPYHYV